MAIFLNGVIKHTCVLPVGGRQLTNDIAFVFRTPLEDAEKIKKEFGCGYPPMVRENDTIQFPSVGGRETRTLSRKILSEVIEARIEEIFSQVQRELIKSGYEDLIASGLVLTGGTALLPGIVETAERVCCLPIRIGYPKHIGGLSEVVNSPMYATGVGLLLHENKNTYTEIEANGNKFFTRLGTKAKNWLFDIL